MTMNDQIDRAEKNLDQWNVSAVVTGMLAGALVGKSLYFIVRSQFPHLNAPNDSLIFFVTVASRPRTTFMNEFREMTDEKYLEDLLHQCHVNADILTKKFNAMKGAFFSMIASVAPWLITLLLIQ